MTGPPVIRDCYELTDINNGKTKAKKASILTMYGPNKCNINENYGKNNTDYDTNGIHDFMKFHV